MAKGKKRKAPPAAAAPAREEPPNLFERLSNKKRFDILGRKVKGETRQLGKLRSAATDRVSGLGCASGVTVCLVRMGLHRGHFDQSAWLPGPGSHGSTFVEHLWVQRKSTLLVEYKQLRKANAFIDRRFGGAGQRGAAHCWLAVATRHRGWAAARGQPAASKQPGSSLPPRRLSSTVLPRYLPMHGDLA